MEITKQNEMFALKDVTEVFEMKGNVACEVSGALNLHITVNKNGGEYVGDCHYSRHAGSTTVNFGVNCSEENRDSLTEYAASVIDHVLAHFNSSI